MKRSATGDVWTDAKLLQAEELAAEARARAAWRAPVRESCPRRRGVRAWLGAALLSTGHRLLGSLASLDRDASHPHRGGAERVRPACPVCRSSWLEAVPHRPRPS